MIPPEIFLKAGLGVLLSALVSGLSYLSLYRFLPEASAAVAVSAGFLTGFFTIGGLGAYAFPPQSVQNWLPHIAVGALLLGLGERYWFDRVVLRWGVRLVLLELLLWRVFQPFINHPFPARRWDAGTTLTNLLLTTLIIAAFWLALDLLLKRSDEANVPAVVPTALMLVAAGSALTIVLAHSIIMGQLTGTLAAALGAVAGLMWLFRDRQLFPVLTPLVALLSALPWLSLFNSLPEPTVILLALAPWLLLIPLGQRQGWQQGFIHLGLVLLPIVGAVLSAWRLS